MSDNPPGNGVFGWLGRQVGYVKKAVTAKPSASPPAKRSAPQSNKVQGDPAQGDKPPQPSDAKPPPQADPAAVLFRQNQVQEAEHPTQPGVKLRRTIIDEVIADPRDADESGGP